jgi:hypothetical protein
MHEVDYLTPIDVVVTAKGQIHFEPASLEDPPESVDAGNVDPAFPPRHRRLRGAKSCRELTLAQARKFAGVPHEPAGVEPAESR